MQSSSTSAVSSARGVRSADGSRGPGGRGRGRGRARNLASGSNSGRVQGRGRGRGRGKASSLHSSGAHVKVKGQPLTSDTKQYAPKAEITNSGTKLK